jgi:hypothetical protein
VPANPARLTPLLTTRCGDANRRASQLQGSRSDLLLTYLIHASKGRTRCLTESIAVNQVSSLLSKAGLAKLGTVQRTSDGKTCAESAVRLRVAAECARWPAQPKHADECTSRLEV